MQFFKISCIRVIAFALHSMFDDAAGAFHLNQTLFPFNFKRSVTTMNECPINDALQQRMGHWVSTSSVNYPAPILQQLKLEPDLLHSVPNSTDSGNSRRPLEQCPLRNEIDARLNERSICSWNWKRNYDRRRLPSLLFEANCLCDKAAKFFPSIVNFECEPVYYQIKVLRFDEHCKKYKRSNEHIAVACVAVTTASSESVYGRKTDDNDTKFEEI